MSNLMVGGYGLASGLIGFYGFDRQPRTTLRVKVTEVRGSYVWVVTADLVDAGTPLTLDASQVQPFEAETVSHYSTGLVVFEYQPPSERRGKVADHGNCYWH